MIDINLVRNDPAYVRSKLAGRHDLAMIDSLIVADDYVRTLRTELQKWEASRNLISKEIGLAIKNGTPVDELKSRAHDTNQQIDKITAMVTVEADKRDAIWVAIPNIPDDVPYGDELANQVMFVSHHVIKNHDAKNHYDLPGFNVTQAGKVSGTRFTYMEDQVAKLHRVLGQFMIDTHTEQFGYKEMDVPLLVNDTAMFGTGQLPKFEEDLFKTTDGRYLIPTGEVPLTNLVANQIIDYNALPLRLVALTPCFRAEAGSAGRDTRGLIRQHQFNKVELVSITEPNNSVAEHEYMVNAAENILYQLELPFRRVLLSAGDMGFGAAKTYDLEVWLPGQKTYREISSISNCRDFQARRMQARVKLPGDKQTTFLHTLNGSGLAVGRTLVAVMENYQTADGNMAIPEALKPYFKNREYLHGNS